MVKKSFRKNFKREMVYKQEGESYATVTKMLGDSRVLATSQSDGMEYLCHIRGQLNKKVWIKIGDIVLISKREYEDKCDVLHKYSDEDSRVLQSQGEIKRTEPVEEKDEVVEFTTDHEEINLEDL